MTQFIESQVVNIPLPSNNVAAGVECAVESIVKSKHRKYTSKCMLNYPITVVFESQDDIVIAVRLSTDWY